MPKYYRFLNLKANFFDQAALTSELSKTLKDPNANQQWRNWGENPDVFTTEAYRWLELFNCDIGTAEAFYTAPKKALGWHTDVSGKSPIVDYVKISIVLVQVIDSNRLLSYKIDKYEPKLGEEVLVPYGREQKLGIVRTAAYTIYPLELSFEVSKLKSIILS
jgi:hypothetical protein